MDLNDLPRSRLKPFSRFEKAILCVLLAMLLLYAGALLSKNYVALPDCQTVQSDQISQLEKGDDNTLANMSFCREQKNG